jgi:hypothetical protein
MFPYGLAEPSFDLGTSGLWAQHASAAPLRIKQVPRAHGRTRTNDLSLTKRMQLPLCYASYSSAGN